MHRPEHFLSFSNVDRVEKPDAARDNVEERDDAFNWGVCCNQMGEGMEFVAIKWGKEMRWNEVGCFSTASPPPDSLQSTSFFFNWESVQWFLVTKGPATVHNDPICSLTHN